MIPERLDQAFRLSRSIRSNRSASLTRSRFFPRTQTLDSSSGCVSTTFFQRVKAIIVFVRKLSGLLYIYCHGICTEFTTVCFQQKQTPQGESYRGVCM